MSFIHKFINDNETTEPVKHLFMRFVSEFEKQNSIVWNTQVKQTTNEYHRKTILKQGRCDFDDPPLKLTSEQLIVLYNYYYFPMHYQSSYEIYSKLFEEREEFQNQTFFFHDFGCGTLSSSMAFGASFQKYNLNELQYENKFNFNHTVHDDKYKYNHIDVLNHLNFYISESSYGDISTSELGEIRNAGDIRSFNLPNLINGFCLHDISISITNFLIGFLKENFYTEPNQDYFFNTALCTDSHFYFGNVADKFYVGNFGYYPIPFESFCNAQNKLPNEITVILNFSYVLASESINTEIIKSLIEEYQKTVCNLIIVNQNPDLDSLNIKWETLKQSLTINNAIKGVQPIKHFGSKSKSRYEILFCSNEAPHILTTKFKSNDHYYNAKIIESFIAKNDIFFQNRLSNILKNNNYNLALKIPQLIEESRSEFYNTLDGTMYFEQNHNEIRDLCNEIKIKILSDIYFIEWLLEEIKLGNVFWNDLIYLFDSSYIISLPVHIRINIWGKILQNDKLVNEFITNHYFEGGLNNDDTKFNNLFVELALKNNYQFLIVDYDLYQYYRCTGNNIPARHYIENIIFSTDYGSFREKIIPEYLEFMSLNFPAEKSVLSIKEFDNYKSQYNNNADLPF